MHRRTFLQSLCVLAAAATIGYTPVCAPVLVEGDGWAYASHLRVGDVLTIEGYFAFNPKTQRYSTRRLQEFRVLAADVDPRTIAILKPEY